MKQSKLLSIVRRFATASLCIFFTSENKAESCLSAKDSSCKVFASQPNICEPNCSTHNCLLRVPSPGVKSVYATLTLFAAANRSDCCSERQAFATLQSSSTTPDQTASATADPFRTSRSKRTEARVRPGADRFTLFEGNGGWKPRADTHHQNNFRKKLHRSGTRCFPTAVQFAALQDVP